MTPEEFGQAASSLPGVVAQAVMDTVVYRVRHKGFATLGWPEAGWAVVKLSAAEQARLTKTSSAFAPEPGQRGRRGVTLIRLSKAEPQSVAQALQAAWRQAYGPTSKIREDAGAQEVVRLRA